MRESGSRSSLPLNIGKRPLVIPDEITQSPIRPGIQVNFMEGLTTNYSSVLRVPLGKGSSGNGCTVSGAKIWTSTPLWQMGKTDFFRIGTWSQLQVPKLPTCRNVGLRTAPRQAGSDWEAGAETEAVADPTGRKALARDGDGGAGMPAGAHQPPLSTQNPPLQVCAHKPSTYTPLP